MANINLETIAQEVEDLGLPQPDQIGFVVANMDEAMKLYGPIFGPLKRTDYGPQTASYHGGAPSAYELNFAFGRAGDLEIELIEWVSGDTPHRDFLKRGGEGMHHLRYRIDSLDRWIAKVEQIGYRVTWTARFSPEVGFAYCEREGDPLVLEFLQYPQTADPSDANL